MSTRPHVSKSRKGKRAGGGVNSASLDSVLEDVGLPSERHRFRSPLYHSLCDLEQVFVSLSFLIYRTRIITIFHKAAGRINEVMWAGGSAEYNVILCAS